MSTKQKSQKGFVAVTLITVLAIAMVIIVYATLLGTFSGKEVVYGETLNGEVLYSKGNQTDPSNWTDTFAVASGSSWYACLNITSTDGYMGQVNVTFQLQYFQNSTPVGSPTSAIITLNGTAGERIYVTSDGTITTNRDWKDDCIAGYSFAVEAKVASTS